MNKLLVSDIIDLNNDNCVLECQSDKLKINSKGNCNVYLINDVETVMTSQNENIKNSMREYLKTINEAQTHKTIIV